MSDQENNWAAMLRMAEFAVNNHVSETTGATHFVANPGHHPRMNVDRTQPPYEIDSPAGLDFANTMAQLHYHL